MVDTVLLRQRPDPDGVSPALAGLCPDAPYSVWRTSEMIWSAACVARTLWSVGSDGSATVTRMVPAPG